MKKTKHRKTYCAWLGAIDRCHNPKNKAFHNYGGRGIIVCDKWRNSYNAFLEDMGESPEKLSLDRRDNNGNYEPGNCRWATKIVQANNTRSNIFIEDLDGEKITVADLCRKHDMDYDYAIARLRAKWTVEKLLRLKPLTKGGRNLYTCNMILARASKEKTISFLEKHYEKHGVPATIREVMKAVGFASPKSVTRYFDELEGEGLIRRHNGHAVPTRFKITRVRNGNTLFRKPEARQRTRLARSRE